MLRGLGGEAKCKRAPDPGTHQNIGKKLEANGRGLFLRDCCTTCNQRLPFLGADMECAGAPAPGTHKIIRRNLEGPPSAAFFLHGWCAKCNQWFAPTVRRLIQGPLPSVYARRDT